MGNDLVNVSGVAIDLKDLVQITMVVVDPQLA